MSKLLMYETYYDKLQTHFGQEKIQLHYVASNSFVLSINTKDFIKDLKNLEDILDFSNIDENHELFKDKNNNLILVNLKLILLKLIGQMNFCF